MANTLTVVAGPPGGGKSRWIRERMAEDPSLMVVDYTAMYAALTGQRRDSEGRYPIRSTGDPKLATVAGVWTRAVEHLAFTGQRGFVTTAKRDRIPSILELADTKRVRVVDPGEAIARQRLADLYGGILPPECENALAGWYGAVV